MPLSSELIRHVILEWDITRDNHNLTDSEIRAGLAVLLRKLADRIQHDEVIGADSIAHLSIFTEQCGWNMKLCVRLGDKDASPTSTTLTD